jgi:hypothetical protein
MLIEDFSPLITHSSLSRYAVVFIAAASLPQ